jgi:hypothetical protein
MIAVQQKVLIVGQGISRRNKLDVARVPLVFVDILANILPPLVVEQLVRRVRPRAASARPPGDRTPPPRPLCR